MRLYTPKKSHQEAVLENINQVLKVVLEYMISIYLLLILAVLPFYNTEGYAHMGTDKATFFDKVSAFAGKAMLLPLLAYIVIGLLLLIKKREKTKITDWIKKEISLTDGFAFLYGAALFLAYLSSDYKDEALWGTQGWYMGFLPQLTLVMIYFLVSRLWEPKKWIFYTVIPVSAAVFFMGVVNRFGGYPFGIESAGEGYISTIGNINWYCGYSVVTVFIGTTLLWRGSGLKAWQRILLMAYTMLGLVSLVLQGSDSGLVTLVIIVLVMFCTSVKDADRMLTFWQEMVLLCAGCLAVYLLQLAPSISVVYIANTSRIITYGTFPVVMTAVSAVMLLLVTRMKKTGKYSVKLFRAIAIFGVAGSIVTVVAVLIMAVVNTRHPGSLGRLSDNPLFTIDARWGSNRLSTWSFGLRCFAEQNLWHKLVGVGPDCMWAFIDSETVPDLYADVTNMFGFSRLTNAHNEWITILVNTGILGCIGFAGMIICGIRDFMRAKGRSALIFACGMALLAYTVNNIFSFQQSMNVSTMFVIFGMGEAFLWEVRKNDGTKLR